MKNSSFFIIDTNILVSGFLFEHSKPAKAIDKAIDEGIVIFSRETLDEFIKTFLHKKFNKYGDQ